MRPAILGVFLATGSSFPVGKVEFLDFYPMSFREFLGALDERPSIAALDEFQEKRSLVPLKHEHLWERLRWYFVVGGLSEVVAKFCEAESEPLAVRFELARAAQEGLIRAYEADIAKHSGMVNSMHITRVLCSVPEQLSGSGADTGTLNPHPPYSTYCVCAKRRIYERKSDFSCST